MKCYKVVRQRGGRLYSAVIERSLYEVEYLPGKWVKGLHGTPLLVFETRPEAQHFQHVRHAYDLEVWECEATRTRPVNLLPPYRDTRTFFRFWGRFSWFRLPKAERPKTAVPTGGAPDGTLAAARVKLTRRIET
jgi:hypothetical protein